LVKGCPKWLAPNMLTLIGFMFTVVPFIWLFIEYGTQFKNMNEIPLWFFWVLFVTFFLS
jgi:phosphatidylglycerophosphate synthase